jgi:hypothetical protein
MIGRAITLAVEKSYILIPSHFLQMLLSFVAGLYFQYRATRLSYGLGAKRSEEGRKLAF